MKDDCRVKMDVPDMRLLLNKLLHQANALLILQHHDLDSSLFQIRLAAHEGLVLSNYYARNFVQNAGARTHVARAERRVHRRTGVCGRRKAS